MPIVVIGLSHRTCPVELRERFAFPEPKIPEAIQKLRAEGVAEEAVIVSTCNRVEIYAASASASGETLEALQQFLVDWCAYRGPLNDEIYRLNEPDSVEHLFQVACGLDSLVLGETEILGQLKKSYDLALQHKHTGSRLNKAFQRAFNVAKQIRTETNIQRGSVSVGSVAVELAEKIFQSLLLIDIAVPRDIEPEVNFLENVYLYNIDDLQTIADDYLKQRREEIARCETIIRDKVRALLGAERHPHSASGLRSGFGHEPSCAA